jgi:mono/diheme cytochrome c family protein
MSNLRTSHRSGRLFAGAAVALPLFGVVWVQAATPPAKPAAPAAKLRYNKDIRPILSENCFACHGPDSAARKADLRLDRPAEATALRNGKAAIVKGNPGTSEMVRRITGAGPIMPPEASHKKLTPQQIATLKWWVTEGAEYESHWSYIPPKRPAVPKVKDMKWVRNPIDNFILARLEREGLKPAPEADRRTLARRLSLDLTGLPPDPADVEAFVADKSPDAYEKLVDKFMASPQWGEHRGRYWLDAARYGDTHGIHIDNFREIWSYRDWVIQALNKNMPFDQFTIEQLAGDLLPNPTLEQRVATGFNRCNITTSEGGAIDEEYKVLYARDRTETTSWVWLGSTLNCAVCHDHKFDPFTQKEFYAFSAFFNNTTQAAMDGNVKDTPPILPVPLEADRPRMEALQPELASVRKQAEERKQAARPDFDAWAGKADATAIAASIPADGLKFHLPLGEGQGREVQATLDGKPLKLTAAADPVWENGHVAAKAFQRKAGSVVETMAAGDFEKDQQFTFSAWVKIPRGDQGGAVIARMDDQKDFRGWDMWLEGGRVGTHIINKWPENALKVVTREGLPANKWTHVCITYNGGAKPESVTVYVNGVAKPTDTQQNSLKDTIRAEVPLKIGQRHTTSGVDGVGIHDVRLYGRALSAQDADSLAKATRAAYLTGRGAQLAAAEKDELFGWWLTGKDEPYRALTGKVAALEAEEREIRARGTIAHVMQERGDAAEAYLLFRGDYDKRRDKVVPITPAVLPALPADFPKNRLGLAKWLLLPDHPLTTRVTVNRFWQELFGTGIVATTNDFGVTGELPSHPELLDWLAIEFRDGGWDMKKFFKLLVTSATYRQSVLITPEKKRKDPFNRLLSRGPRFRMDGEMIRDYALASSGLLVKKLGGPSVKPYQPDGVWEAVAMIGSNTRDYKRDTGESLYRRSMYTFWKRSAPPASMDIFNAPSREVCTVRRERTNTPLQALVTLNDVQFVEAARHLAQRTLKEGGPTDAARADYMARRLLARPLKPAEQTVVAKSLASLEGHYATNANDAKALIAMGESKADASLDAGKLAAWTMLANQMMNLDEVLCK